MPTHTKHDKKEIFYFVTFTCYKWLPLLERSDIYPFLSNWISEINKRGILTCGYVFMPNHIHLLVYVQRNAIGLNYVIGEGKRFLAYEIVKRLKLKEENAILDVLQKGVQSKEHKIGKVHQVFRSSFDAKEVVGVPEINRVLDYIHANPVSGKWKLVKEYINYPYSSAAYYEFGKNGNIEVFDFRDVVASESPPDDSAE